jgi:hypothetical protein
VLAAERLVLWVKTSAVGGMRCAAVPPSRVAACGLLVVCLQAKQDMEQVKQIAGSAVNKLANMAGRFMNDLSRY